MATKPPQLDHVYPAGAARGTSTEIELVGSFENWPPKIWSSSGDMEFNFLEEKGKAVLTIGQQAPLGPQLIRCYNEWGSSTVRFFVISQTPEIAESEENDRLSQAIPIREYPAIVNGRLQSRGDVDSYQVSLRQGQCLIAEAYAYRIQSTMDPLLQVVDQHGAKLAFNHDHYRLDPFLSFQAPSTGLFTLQIMGFEYPAKADIRLGGGKTYIYRLHLDNGPYLQTALPPEHTRNTKMIHRLRGWNLPDQQVTLSHTPSEPENSAEATVEVVTADRRFEIPLTDLRQELEQTGEHIGFQSVPVPGAVTGQISTDGEEDHYRVKLEKDNRYTIKLKTQAPIHQFDAWLELSDLEGKQLQRNDDAAESDPIITFSPTDTAEYDLAIGNLFDYGAEDFIYHLTIEPTLTRFEAALSISQTVLPPGTTNSVTVSVTRLGDHEGDIQFRFRNLPTTITQTGGLAENKKSSCDIQMVSRDNAPPFLGEVFLWATELSTKAQYPVPVKLVGTSVNNGVPGGFKELIMEETPTFWITIPPPEPTEDTVAKTP